MYLSHRAFTSDSLKSDLNRAIIQKKKASGKSRTPQTLPIEAKDRIYTPMEIFHNIFLTPS